MFFSIIHARITRIEGKKITLVQTCKNLLVPAIIDFNF